MKLNLSIFVVISFLLLSCKNESNQTTQVEEVTCSPYFDFDKIEHYQINDKIIEKLNKNENAKYKKLREVLRQNFCEENNKFRLLDSLEILGYKKSILNDSNFNTLNSFFCETRIEIENVAKACIKNYRDILIFKKSNKLIGFAKICFECGDYFITDNTNSYKQYPLNGNLDELHDKLYLKTEK